MSFLFEKLTREECEAIREADGFDNGYSSGYEQGKADGYEHGETDGYKRGETAGFEKGNSEGALSASIRIATNLKANGMSVEDISKNTGLTTEQISNL